MTSPRLVVYLEQKERGDNLAPPAPSRTLGNNRHLQKATEGHIPLYRVALRSVGKKTNKPIRMNSHFDGACKCLRLFLAVTGPRNGDICPKKCRSLQNNYPPTKNLKAAF